MQTVTAGVWCLSPVPELAAIKVSNGYENVEVASHSASGKSEFLIVQTRIAEVGDHVAISPRSHTNSTSTTGKYGRRRYSHCKWRPHPDSGDTKWIEHQIKDGRPPIANGLAIVTNTHFKIIWLRYEY
jgi:hypothetical protein